MQCKQLEAVLEQDGLTPLPAAAEEHLAECAACRSFLADLSLIAEKAHELPAEVERPQRIWLSVRAQLQAEGLIQEPVEVPAIVGAAPWWQNLAELFRPRNLAAAGAALILIFVVALQIRKSNVGPGQPPASQARGSPTQVSPAPTQQHPVKKERAGPAQASEQTRTQTPQGLAATAIASGAIVQNKPVVAAARPGSFAPLRPS